MKKLTDIKSCLETYCEQKHLDFIDNSNILEKHLGKKKPHLNKRGNSVSENNFIKYLRPSFLILDDFSYVRDFQTEQLISTSFCIWKNCFTNNVSEKSLRVIRQKNLKSYHNISLKHQFYKE